MSRRKSDGIKWVLVVLFALAGFLLRLHLDEKFDSIVDEAGPDESGMVDSFMLRSTENLVKQEGDDE